MGAIQTDHYVTSVMTLVQDFINFYRKMFNTFSWIELLSI